MTKFDTKLTSRFNFSRSLAGYPKYIYTMRAPRIKMRTLQPGCVICRQKACIDDKATQDLCRITRSITKLLQNMSFILIEVYRCMPLLGDEQEKVPDWDMHIVRYAVVFVKK